MILSETWTTITVLSIYKLFLKLDFHTNNVGI